MGQPYPAISRLWRNAWLSSCRSWTTEPVAECVSWWCPSGWSREHGSWPKSSVRCGAMSCSSCRRMREWLPSDHLVWFILDTLEALDLTGLEATRRRGGVGAAGYDPRMLLGLLVYGYCRGVRSSRQIERLCGTDVAFRVLCAQDVPDHCTLARFRADCQDGFISLFTDVLMIAGLPAWPGSGP